MASEPSGLDRLLSQWRSFSVSDRKAITARLPLEQREELLRLTFSDGGPGPAPNHRFRIYSGWLATLIEQCEAGETSLPLTAAARAELLSAHQAVATQASSDSGHVSPWDILQSLLQRLRAAL